MKGRKNKITQKVLITRVNIALIGVVVSTVVGGMFLSNHGANQGYAYAKSMVDYELLESEHRKLLNRVAELQSTGRLTAESERLQLVKAEQISYVSVPGTVVLNR